MLTQIKKQKKIHQKGTSKILIPAIIAIIIVIIAFLVYFTKMKQTPEEETKSIEHPPEVGLQYLENTDKLVKNTSIGSGVIHDELVRHEREELTNKIVKLNPVKDSYQPGDSVEIKGSVENFESFPMVNMQLYAMILRKDSNAENREKNNDLLVDQFLIFDNVNINPITSFEFNYQLVIPNKIKNGTYYLRPFLLQDDRFSWSGGDPLARYNRNVQVLEFNVSGGEERAVYIDKDDVLIKSPTKGEFRQEFLKKANIVSDNEIEVRYKIVNEFDQEKEVQLSYIYQEKNKYLESLRGGDIIGDVVKDTIKIGPGETKELTHSFNIKGKYYSFLQIILSSDGQKSILNVPIVAEQVNYTGTFFKPEITKFPIKKGEIFKVFSGFYYKKEYQSKDSELSVEEAKNKKPSFQKEGKVEVALFDKDNQEIGLMVFDGTIDNQNRAWQNEVVSQKDINYIKMQGKIYDKNGIVTEEFERIYDCEKLGVNSCITHANSKGLSLVVTIVVALFSISLITLIFLKKR